MADNYETLIKWFLRFNGYFGVENFVIHEPLPRNNQQGGETDILGVRFPFSREQPGFVIANYSNLLDEKAQQRSLIDVVIAEVKNRDDDYLNDIWIKQEPKYVDRVAYIIRWIGALKDERKIHCVASRLKEKYRCQIGRYLFRFIYFGRQRHQSLEKLGIRQITFQEVVQFLLLTRTPSFYVNDLGVRSHHNQWDPLIKEIWRVGDPDSPQGIEEQEAAIFDLLDNYNLKFHYPTLNGSSR
jgi:hypothetical protein